MVNLKTDKSVHDMWGRPFNSRVKTRGYPELVDDRDQLNPLIHRWINKPHIHNLLSVSTDYYLRLG